MPLAVNLKFDSTNKAQAPTLILANKNGRLLGEIPANAIQYKDTLSGKKELRFTVNKADCFDSNLGYINEMLKPPTATTDDEQQSFPLTASEQLQVVSYEFWKQIRDFKLIWAKEWNIWFEMYVVIEESDDISKTVQAYSLGEEELSQIKLYNIECNTEADISRDDYVPTVLYNGLNPSASLLHRITEKAPHYTINHVDLTLTTIQRIFTFDNVSIYDAFKEISEEIDCLFIIRCYTNSSGVLTREINVYDMESYCQSCHSRGDFYDTCDECGSDQILNGYGDDAPILVTIENLADNISFDVDESSVKNCFRLIAGDDLMTATIRNCNPDGTSYLWCITDEARKDMTLELSSQIRNYFDLYTFYFKQYQTTVSASLLRQYNNLVQKYQTQSGQTFLTVPSSITGYPDIMKYYYDTIDFYLYLNDGMMPNLENLDITAEEAAVNLTSEYLSPVAVANLSTCSAVTAQNAVLSVAKCCVDQRYDLRISNGSYSNNTWSGNFIVTSKTNESDTYTTENVSIEITDDIDVLLDQNIHKMLGTQQANSVDVATLFDIEDLEDFEDEIAKYSLSMLISFRDMCQSCVDIIVQEINNINGDIQSYILLYRKYALKLNSLDSEIELRRSEIAIIMGRYDADGEVSAQGMQTFLNNVKSNIWQALNLENYLGSDLWHEFCAYRMEDSYSNSNYISDGLNNAELFENAMQFRDIAKKAINDAAKKHHSISATLKNLLAIKDFQPIVRYFALGNRIRIRIDGTIYVLRLFSYEINFDDLNNLSVKFSDENRNATPRHNHISAIDIANQVNQIIKIRID